LKVQGLSIEGQVLVEDAADLREVFRVPNIDLEEGLPTPLCASNSVELLGMGHQGIQVVKDFQRLLVRLADVLTHMTDHARRAGNEQVRAGYG